MSRKIPKVLIIATSHKTRGGITSVVLAHEAGEQWKEYHCKWLETHIDRSAFYKVYYFLKSFISYLYILPFYNLVHIHVSEPPSAIRKALYLWYARLFKKKIIVHFHAFSPNTTINSKYKSVYRYLFSRADLVLVLSQYWKTEINKTFGFEIKLDILYNPSSTSDYSKHYSKKKHILYAGTVNERKGYVDMINAFATIATQFPDWKIVFAGNGEVEKGKQLAKELKIENQSIFLGWVSGVDKSKAFQEASIFCLPSYAEGFPMAVLDAWAYGLPVITTPVGGLPDVLVDRENALVFNQGDVKELSKALKEMISNEELRTKIADASTQLSKTTFDKCQINNKLGEIYKSLQNPK